MKLKWKFWQKNLLRKKIESAPYATHYQQGSIEPLAYIVANGLDFREGCIIVSSSLRIWVVPTTHMKHRDIGILLIETLCVYANLFPVLIEIPMGPLLK